jgi:hypothetical protein
MKQFSELGGEGVWRYMGGADRLGVSVLIYGSHWRDTCFLRNALKRDLWREYD